MTTATVTSKTGKQIELTNNGSGVIARCGDISFGADQTAEGFASRFAVMVNGRAVKIDVALAGDDLARCNALFAAMRADVSAAAADHAAHDKRRAAVLSMMAE